MTLTQEVALHRWARRRLEWPYRVGPSRIHGCGAIATRFIARGELVPLRAYLCLDEFQGFNHSCENNLGGVRDSRTCFRLALRAVRPGEELTVDYRAFYLDETLPFGWCHCPLCRGLQ